MIFGPKSKFKGDIFVGEVREEKPNGHGTYIFGPESKYAGDIYVGQWKNGQKNGYGNYTFSDGRVREGIWINNVLYYDARQAE